MPSRSSDDKLQMSLYFPRFKDLFVGQVWAYHDYALGLLIFISASRK
jgi:hypothetical protein